MAWWCCAVACALSSGCAATPFARFASLSAVVAPAKPAAPSKSQAASTTVAQPIADKTIQPLPSVHADDNAAKLVAAQVPQPIPNSTFMERLKLPPDIPGASAPPIQIPSGELPQQSRNDLIDELFPNRPLPSKLNPPAGAPTTLAQIQELALANNPEIVQASADVTAAMGTAIQAGVHPNPTIGYEADTVGSAGTRNYQGVFGTQTIKTAGKLELARAAANMDLMNAQLALRRTRMDLLARIKAAYYSVLVVQQNVAIASAMASFTNDAYRIQVDKLRAGESAAYESAQMRSLAVQARTAQIQAQNRYIAAWKQLAALVGLPNMPPAELEGRVDMPIPLIHFDAMLAYVLNNHPDVLMARNLEAQARFQLQLQRVTPIPDVQLYGTFQRDFTTPNSPRTTYNLQCGVPLPIFDRNRGNIINAEGNLRRASEQLRRTQNELTARVADAFQRLENARYVSQAYREQVLPDLGRAFRGIYQRHQQEPQQIGFVDIVVAQQNLATGLATYIDSLNQQWTALADIANLMQVETFEELGGPIVPPVEMPSNIPEVK